jgi:hypothetical protein
MTLLGWDQLAFIQQLGSHMRVVRGLGDFAAGESYQNAATTSRNLAVYFFCAGVTTFLMGKGALIATIAVWRHHRRSPVALPRVAAVLGVLLLMGGLGWRLVSGDQTTGWAHGVEARVIAKAEEWRAIQEAQLQAAGVRRQEEMKRAEIEAQEKNRKLVELLAAFSAEPNDVRRREILRRLAHQEMDLVFQRVRGSVGKDYQDLLAGMKRCRDMAMMDGDVKEDLGRLSQCLESTTWHREFPDYFEARKYDKLDPKGAAALDVTTNLILAGEQDDELSKLLDRGVPVNGVAKMGRTLLTYAIENRRLKAVEILLAHGADVNFPDPMGWMPIHVAVMRGNVAVARKLLEAKADVNAQVGKGTSAASEGAEGMTALSMAAGPGAMNVEMVKLLLGSGANPNIADARKQTALDRFYVVPASGRVTEVEVMLSEHGAKRFTELHASAE